MDGNRFDRLTRRLTTPRAWRRLLVAAPVAALAARLADSAAASAKKRCKKSKRCGKDCCKESSCFPKEIDPNTGEVTSLGCCSAEKLCLDPIGDRGNDQCCYSDETCNPNGGQGNNGNGLCCRTCGAVCCSSSEQCENGQCAPLSTARLPRRRPA